MSVKLMSIKPKWAKEIYSGKKSIEYRKGINTPNVDDLVFLYESDPVKAVTGVILVDCVIKGPARYVWLLSLKGGEPGSLNWARLSQYLDKARYLSALIINSPIKFDEPVPLYNFRPPQSWMTLNGRNLAQNVLARTLLNKIRPTIKADNGEGVTP